MISLEVKNISKSFGGVQAVAGCSFGIERGKITALIGPNGAGKTTVFNIVNGFLPLDKGEVIFEGRRINELEVWERSRLGMSRTFQLPRAFRNLTIYENLILALREDDDRFWKMITSRTHDEEREEKIKKTMDFVGLKKNLKTKVTILSYGETRLFELTRALLNPHTLLLLDEPVAGVNPLLRQRLVQILEKLKKEGETILLIEHDMDFVKRVADWVLVMVEGRIMKEGLPQDIFKDKKVLEAYLGPDFKNHAA